MFYLPNCYIAGASPQAQRVHPRPGDFLIAADGGLDHWTRWGLVPDLLVGDLDSLACAPPGDIPCVKYPKRKDDTDLALAIDEALARGYGNLILTGAWGGRPDHSVAALQLLVNAAQRGARVKMLCGGFTATVIAGGGALRLEGKGTVSVFAWGGEAGGVTIQGLEYPLAHAALSDGHPLGVSNFLSGAGEITLERGALLVFFEEDIKCDIA